MTTVPNINRLAMPFRCWNADWGESFDRPGWSTCSKNNLFITALYRSDPLPNEDPISLLDGARCCTAALEFSGGRSECDRADWGAVFNGLVHLNHIPTQLCTKVRLTKFKETAK